MAKYTESVLRAAVEQSLSVAGVLRDLGLVPAGGTHAHVSRLIKRYGIDTSHFTGQGWRQNRTFPYSGPPGELLQLLPEGSPRTNGQRLRRALIDRTSPRLHIVRKQWRMADDPTCAASRSHQRELHRPSNLRFLCPNCHTQCPTHSGRNKKKVGSASPPWPPHTRPGRAGNEPTI